MGRLLALWRLAKGDLKLLWIALRHPDRPAWLLPATVLLALFALDPANFAIPFVGVLDDFVVLPLLLHGLLTFLPSQIRGASRRG